MTDQRLPSWRSGRVRETTLDYLDGIGDVPIADRVAYVGNDGTLWCERSTYIQLDFFVDELRRRVAEDASVAHRPEFGAVLRGDAAATGELGLARIGTAPAGLFAVHTPREFGAALDGFLARYVTIGLVTGGGTDREMLEWANAGPHPGLAILVDHDLADREYAYEDRAATLAGAEPITAVAARLGWVVASMRDDWATVFPPGR